MNITLPESTANRAALSRLMMRTGGFRKLYLSAMKRACVVPLLIYLIYHMVPSFDAEWIILLFLPYGVIAGCLKGYFSLQILLDNAYSSRLLIDIGGDGFHLQDSLGENRLFIHATRMMRYQLDDYGLIVYGPKGGIVMLYYFPDIDSAEKSKLMLELRERLDAMLKRSEAEGCDCTDYASTQGELFYVANDVSESELMKFVRLQINRRFVPYYILLAFVYCMLLPCCLCFSLALPLLQTIVVILIIATTLSSMIAWWYAPKRKLQVVKSERQLVPLLRYAKLADDSLVIEDSQGSRQLIKLADLDECQCLPHNWLICAKGEVLCACMPNVKLPAIQALPKTHIALKPSLPQLLKQSLLALLLTAMMTGLSLWLIEMLAVLQ